MPSWTASRWQGRPATTVQANCLDFTWWPSALVDRFIISALISSQRLPVCPFRELSSVQMLTPGPADQDRRTEQTASRSVHHGASPVRTPPGRPIITVAIVLKTTRQFLPPSNLKAAETSSQARSAETMVRRISYAWSGSAPHNFQMTTNSQKIACFRITR